nr:hypothetical protein [Tanacetum cinerariifolium]
EIISLNDVVVDQMHQPWRTFVALINRGLFRKTSGRDNVRLSRAQILWDNTLSWRNKIRMHTSKDDYLIITLRSVSVKESTQIYGAILLECLTTQSTTYKTYLGYVTCSVPPKIARKLKKTSPSKKEPSVETKSKRKEKVDVTHGKGIELLSEVGTGAKKPPRVDKITPTVTSEGTGDKPGVPDVTIDESAEKNKSDDNKTPSQSEKGSDSEQDTDGSESDSESDQQEYEEEVKDDDDDHDDDDEKSEGDEDRGMEDTTNQFSDDVQDKKDGVEMTDAQQEKENLKIT